PGAGEHAQKRHFRQAHRRRAVIDHDDLVAGERHFIAAAGAGAIDRGDEFQAALPRRFLDAVPRLVGEFAEIDLPGMGRGAQHVDIGAGAEHALLARGQHDGAHLRMLEADAVQRIVELDIDAEIIGIELELVAGLDAARLIDIEHQRRDIGRHVEPPMPIALGLRVERDHRLSDPCGENYSACRGCVKQYDAWRASNCRLLMFMICSNLWAVDPGGSPSMAETSNLRVPSKAARFAVFGRFNTGAGDVADIAIHESHLAKGSRRAVGLQDWLRLATNIAASAAPAGSQLAALTAIGVGAPPLGFTVAEWWKDEDFESKHPRNPKGQPGPGQFRNKTPEEIAQGKTRLAADLRRVQARREFRIVVMRCLAAAVEGATTPIPVLGQIDDALAVANIAAAIKEFHDLAIDVAAAVDFLRKAPYTLDQLRVSPESISFPSYDDFYKVGVEKHFRRAGDGQEYHHIVEDGGDN